jgi:hypothetical protein
LEKLKNYILEIKESRKIKTIEHNLKVENIKSEITKMKKEKEEKKELLFIYL